VMDKNMATYISLLRGINVSGKNKINMDELRCLYESLDFTHVRTYIQSGNVIFNTPEIESFVLSEKIEKEITQSLDFSISVLIRTDDDFRRIIENNPFITAKEEDFSRLYITFLYRSPAESVVRKLSELNSKPDEFSISNKEIYLHCPNGCGKTRLSNNFFEKKLGMPATSRNWKTVNKLYRLASESEFVSHN
jgi:uncharacterized protein (DUF1697 family)